MDYNYGMNSKSMSESITEIFNSIHDVISTYRKVSIKSMSIMQHLGYNGFKRWHRYRSKCLFEIELKLANKLYDNFRIVPNFKDLDVNYNPSNIEEHLRSWDKLLLDSVQELGKLNIEFTKQTGMSCELIEKSICMLSKDYEKVGRYLKRFNDSDWLTLDIHIVDEHLHEKFKKLEEEKDYD
jgi:archaellum component FlaC